MSRTKKRLGIAGAVVGVGAAGVGAAVAARRYAVGRTRLRPDPEAGEPFGGIRGQVLPVRTGDGVALHVEVDGDLPSRSGRSRTGRTRAGRLLRPGRSRAAAPLTVVFCHGYALTQDSWHYQRRDLRESLGDGVRLVFWDQRGHGRSERGDPERVSIDQLGTDLRDVLAAVAPEGGPVVLAGHSMGGMTIMALAEQSPDLFGGQVIGVALVSTSAGGPEGFTLGLPPLLGSVFSTTAPRVVRVLGTRPKLVERARRVGEDITFLATRRLGFVDRKVSPAVVDFVDRMIQATPIEVIADFYAALTDHDKRAALEPLGAVPTLVLAGERDRFTPLSHARLVAAAVPGAELVEIPTCGHLPLLEQPDVVHGALMGLLERVAGSYLPATGERTA